jgi:DNA-binding NarL/FixJ family response regulator
MTDSARDRALIRDLTARARLADDPIAQIKMRRRNVGPQYKPPSDDLTTREREVLTYLSRGLEYEMVADALILGAETVKSHVKSARAKLRAKNTVEACCEAIRLGLIP